MPGSQYSRRDDAVNQVLPVLDKYAGSLYHEASDFSAFPWREVDVDRRLTAATCVQHMMMVESSSYFN